MPGSLLAVCSWVPVHFNVKGIIKHQTVNIIAANSAEMPILIYLTNVFLHKKESISPCNPSAHRFAFNLSRTLLLIFRHNDLPWNIRKFTHNNLEKVNLTHNVKYIDPWAKSPWSHTDIQRMRQGQIGCQVSFKITSVYNTSKPFISCSKV